MFKLVITRLGLITLMAATALAGCKGQEQSAPTDSSDQDSEVLGSSDAQDSSVEDEDSTPSTEVDGGQSDSDVASLDGDTEFPKSEVLDASLDGDIALLEKQSTSSFQSCLCWKKGNECSLPGGPTLPADPAKLCPADEVCDGDSSHKYPDGSVAGTCHKLCVLTGVDVVGTKECDPAEICEARSIISGFEGQTIVKIAICVPADKPIGRTQDGGGTEK